MQNDNLPSIDEAEQDLGRQNYKYQNVIRHEGLRAAQSTHELHVAHEALQSCGFFGGEKVKIQKCHDGVVFGFRQREDYAAFGQAFGVISANRMLNRIQGQRPGVYERDHKKGLGKFTPR